MGKNLKKEFFIAGGLTSQNINEALSKIDDLSLDTPKTALKSALLSLFSVINENNLKKLFTDSKEPQQIGNYSKIEKLAYRKLPDNDQLDTNCLKFKSSSSTSTPSRVYAGCQSFVNQDDINEITQLRETVF